MSLTIKKLLKTLGPGILFASTAIGVSHLVQSTRAGANYGFYLLIFIVLANILKHPFFEFGSRYACATGESILAGYRKLGKWVLVLYLLLSLATMFTVTAAVTLVTAGLLGNIFGITLSLPAISAIIFIVCMLILGIGQFKVLDGTLKAVATVLLLSTLTAFIMALWKGPAPRAASFVPPVLSSKSSILFVIALMGWMPTAVDLSAWNSIWTIERIKQTGYHPKLKETLLDFNLGYFISAGLSICFLTLGALLMYGTGEQLSDSAIVFSGQLINLYTSSIGAWCKWIISIAAFSTMFSTTITVLDGYSRAMNETISRLFIAKPKQDTKNFYVVIMVIIAAISFFVISYLSHSLSTLVDLATTLSFLIAPVIAVINFKIINRPSIKKAFRPPKWLNILALTGIAFLALFALIYVVVYFS